MNSNNFKWFGQFLATLGVVISLTLVAFELKQARDVAMAQIYQERTAILIGSIVETMDVEAFTSAREKMHAEKPLSWVERASMHDDLFVSLLFADNSHYQYTLGLIPEEEWLVVQEGINRMAKAIAEDNELLARWNEIYSFGFRASFAQILEAEIAGVASKSKTPRPKD